MQMENVNPDNLPIPHPTLFKSTEKSKELVVVDKPINKTGRKGIEITDDLLKKAEALAAQGLTNQEIAYCIGMGESTLYEKAKRYPELMESIEVGRAKGVQIIANAVFNKAKAGHFPAQKFFLERRGDWHQKSELEVDGTIKMVVAAEHVDM